MNRFDVCEGYWLYYYYWHGGGVTGRCVRQGRGIAQQLHRMGFKPGPLLSLLNASEGSIAVYNALVKEYHAPVPPEA